MTRERLSRLGAALAALIAAAALGGLAALVLARTALPGVGDQARIERVVHDYVLAHPEIIPEAMRQLQDRQTGAEIAALRAQVFTPFGSAWSGNPKGDLTIVEYFDYNCGFCRASLPTIKQLIARDPKLRVVYRELPVLSEESRLAARYSLVAARAGKFAAFHEALYDGGRVSEASLAAAVAKAGLSMDAVRAAAQDPAIDTEIDTNYAVSRRLGMTGTPSWVIGDHVVSAALPIEELEREIARARARR